ncbi:MAG: tetratricopeptide repeat protein [Alphaproteobacteria bacterium]
MRLSLLALAIAIAAASSPITAARAQVTAEQHNADYDQCVSLAAADPDAAIKRAQSWWQSGANQAARQCLGYALAQKGHYVQAGKIFEDLAADAREPILDLKAGLYAQAGQAYYLGGMSERAIEAFDRAIALKPGNADLLIDRAVARDDARMFFEAIDDLNAAIEIEANRPEAWLYRAAAYRHVGSLDLALEDANRAVALSQRSPEALFERARIKELRKDLAGARTDLQSLIKLAPDSVQGIEAAKRLKTLGQGPASTGPAAAPPARR